MKSPHVDWADCCVHEWGHTVESQLCGLTTYGILIGPPGTGRGWMGHARGCSPLDLVGISRAGGFAEDLILGGKSSGTCSDDKTVAALIEKYQLFPGEVARVERKVREDIRIYRDAINAGADELSRRGGRLEGDVVADILRLYHVPLGRPSNPTRGVPGYIQHGSGTTYRSRMSAPTPTTLSRPTFVFWKDLVRARWR